MAQEWRDRIRTGVLLDNLQKHAQGEKELSASQIKATEILLRKTIPDLKAVEHTGGLDMRLMVERAWLDEADDTDSKVE